MNTIFRIPTKAQYSYVELQGEVKELLAMTKDELVEILEKHNNACKVAKTIDMTSDERFIDGLGDPPQQANNGDVAPSIKERNGKG